MRKTPHDRSKVLTVQVRDAADRITGKKYCANCCVEHDLSEFTKEVRNGKTLYICAKRRKYKGKPQAGRATK